MQCPNCGFELSDDHLICEKCGAEIQFVPDFEPELEESISEVLQTVAEEIDIPANGTGKPVPYEHPKTDERPLPYDHSTQNGRASVGDGLARPATSPQRPVKIQYREEEQTSFGEYVGKFRWLFVAFAGIILLALVFALTNYSITAYQRNSPAYQQAQAEEYFAAGDYRNAIAIMARVVELRPNDIGVRLTWANYYHANGEYDQAVGVLLEAIASPNYTWAQKDQCYDRIIELWAGLGRYEEVVSFLIRSRDEELLRRYDFYLAAPPVFSADSGDYSDSLTLYLSAGGRGKIYYTTDGSEPTTESRVYSAPLFMEAGDYYIAALFENEYGILSEVIVHEYFIYKGAPEPPQVALTNGRYIELTFIEVEVPEGCSVYYTTDGSFPNSESSELYTEPIAIPFGITEYCFVAINAEGIASESVERIFEYRLESSITPEIALANLRRGLLNKNWISDFNGKAPDKAGYYRYTTDETVEIARQGLFYKIIEHYSEDGEEWQATGNLFGADAYTGAPVHLVYIDGVLDIVAIE
jgi:tetratricopeptide (TPR) repeat protein